MGAMPGKVKSPEIIKELQWIKIEVSKYLDLSY